MPFEQTRPHERYTEQRQGEGRALPTPEHRSKG